jgi:hypothetical protein
MTALAIPLFHMKNSLFQHKTGNSVQYIDIATLIFHSLDQLCTKQGKALNFLFSANSPAACSGSARSQAN